MINKAWEKTGKDTGAKESETFETAGLGDDGRDAVDYFCKRAQPRTLDKATAVRVQQWWNDTRKVEGFAFYQTFRVKRKTSATICRPCRAAYDQKYGIRPDEVGLPHRRTPSAR